MKLLRWLIGRIILFFDFVFSPNAPKRSIEQQAAFDQATEHMNLYQLAACPFCVKVRRAMKRQGLNIQTRDIKEAGFLEELVEQGGKRTVPCLKINNADGSVNWMYESNDIIHYLEKTFK